ncbi:carbohydrate-binding family 9-like protein [Portibacter marinus]|uniref:carbohydrate-binding family 9-like protein n=1 Tax=Portibacter marinus TaxID=2898660 RepID=UPI001F2D275A|nr:carbohydrate-binding family 9-like protein [Portibacter marinus]
MIHNIGLSQDCDSLIYHTHPIPFKPRIYNASYISEPPIIDGVIDDEVWFDADLSSDFIDIEGELRPLPDLKTNVKMLWDSTFLYVAAILEESHVWATLQNKDDIIFHDDDFEVFIDADGDGHNYHEIEINAFNTVWDLWMLYPYYIDRRKNYIMEWEAKQMQTAVHVQGSINDASDLDDYWSVEMAIPIELIGTLTDYWRINFSRVDWVMNVEDGQYVKQKNHRERNWVWSPTGVINMHKPETWGYLFFTDAEKLPEVEHFKWQMWQMYHAIKNFKKRTGDYPGTLQCFQGGEQFEYMASPVGFDLLGKHKKETWLLNEMGRISQVK